MDDGKALLRELDWADAILVGAAAGMSAASGFNHYYGADERFKKYSGVFRINTDMKAHSTDTTTGIRTMRHAGRFWRGQV